MAWYVPFLHQFIPTSTIKCSPFVKYFVFFCSFYDFIFNLRVVSLNLIVVYLRNISQEMKWPFFNLLWICIDVFLLDFLTDFQPVILCSSHFRQVFPTQQLLL